MGGTLWEGRRITCERWRRGDAGMLVFRKVIVLPPTPKRLSHSHPPPPRWGCHLRNNRRWTLKHGSHPASALCRPFLLFGSVHIPCLFLQGSPYTPMSVLLHRDCPLLQPPLPGEAQAPVPSSRAVPSGMPSLGASTGSAVGLTSIPTSLNPEPIRA